MKFSLFSNESVFQINCCGHFKMTGVDRPSLTVSVPIEGSFSVVENELNLCQLP